jgi:hypothetical protein
MTKTLYEEAVADANALRQLAEETAKNRIVEAVMPQIRAMVNQRIMGEDVNLDDLEIPEDPLDFSEIENQPVEDHGVEKPDEGGATTVINVDASGDVNFEIEGEEAEDDPIITGSMSEALLNILSSHSKDSKKISEYKSRLSKLESRLYKFKQLMENVDFSYLNSNQTNRINKVFKVCVKEAVILKKSAILIEQATQEEDLEQRLTKIIKEMRNMSKSNSRNIFDFLFEGDEDVKEMDKGLDEAELSLELSDDEREDLAGAEDAEAVDSALEAILGDLEVGMSDAPEGEEGDAAEEPEGEEMGGEEPEAEEIELPEADKVEETVYEIDESALRRELMRLTEEAADEVDQFGGGEAPVGDVFVDVDEDDLINALADELGAEPDAPAVTAESRRRSRRSSRQLREAKRQIAQYQGTVKALKRQLVEMNLFNAKLLYANKLMQNKNLTMKQQKSIVEALDNAKTIREAKLLFRSLSEALVRKKGTRKLTEGSLRTLGASSRSTRSAAPKTNGNEADRWAVLAGLNS